jgi:hypothetical protein
MFEILEKKSNLLIIIDVVVNDYIAKMFGDSF